MRASVKSIETLAQTLKKSTIKKSNFSQNIITTNKYVCKCRIHKFAKQTPTTLLLLQNKENISSFHLFSKNQSVTVIVLILG